MDHLVQVCEMMIRDFQERGGRRPEAGAHHAQAVTRSWRGWREASDWFTSSRFPLVTVINSIDGVVSLLVDIGHGKHFGCVLH